MQLELTDLARLRYANYPDWIELSGGTRRIVDGAANVANSSDRRRVEPILGIAKRLRAGGTFAELIAVHEGSENLVLVEGHARATAYAVVRPSFNLELLVGSSPGLGEWAFYPKVH